MQHMITKILSVRSMSINDSDVQGRIVRRRARPLNKIALEGGGKRRRVSRSVWLPADTNMASSVLCQSDINQA